MLLVLGVHARPIIADSSAASHLLILSTTAVVYLCNPIFFMVSGYFNLRVQDTKADLLQWYYKKCRNIVVPILVYMLLRTVFLVDDPSADLIGLLKTYVKNVLGLFSASEYWFVYSLISLLLVAPFLARMIHMMTTFECKVFLALGISFSAISTILLNRSLQFSWSWFFFGYPFYFLMGGILPRIITTKRCARILELAAPLGLIGTVFVTSNGLIQRAYDHSPLFILFSVGSLFVLLHIGSRIGRNRLVTLTAKHSFGIYLAHMLTLPHIRAVLSGLFGPESIITYLLTVACTYLVTLGLSIILDSILVKPCQLALDALKSIVRNLYGTHEAAK